MRVAGLCAAVVLIGACPAWADRLIFGFGGAVDSVFDPQGLLTTLNVQVGKQFSGVYAFNPNAGDANPDPKVGDYPSYSLFLEYFFKADVEGLHVQSKDYGAVYPGMEIVVRDYGAGSQDDYWVNVDRPMAELYPLPGVHSLLSDIQLTDLDGTALSSTDLLLAPPSLAPWEAKDWRVAGYSLSGDMLFEVRGALESLYLAQGATLTIPEPSSFVLLLFASGGLLAHGWRRRKRHAPA
jgi:hypothetical protein